MRKAGIVQPKTTAIIGLLFTLITGVCLIGCGSDPIRLEGVDLPSWKSDSDGCNQKRDQWVPLILRQKEKILAQSESAVIELLGKPDGIELYKRNQKLYHYRISPGNGCPLKDSLNKEVLIRFNAMGRAKEIYSTPE